MRESIGIGYTVQVKDMQKETKGRIGKKRRGRGLMQKTGKRR